MDGDDVVDQTTQEDGGNAAATGGPKGNEATNLQMARNGIKQHPIYNGLNVTAICFGLPTESAHASERLCENIKENIERRNSNSNC